MPLPIKEVKQKRCGATGRPLTVNDGKVTCRTRTKQCPKDCTIEKNER
ncbi:MAG: hypothetical protein WAW59_02095 [Patescibacteria group bacterium]